MTIIFNILFLEILFVFCVDVFATIIVKYKELVHSPVKKNRSVSHYNIMSIGITHFIYDKVQNGDDR